MYIYLKFLTEKQNLGSVDLSFTSELNVLNENVLNENAFLKARWFVYFSTQNMSQCLLKLLL